MLIILIKIYKKEIIMQAIACSHKKRRREEKEYFHHHFLYQCTFNNKRIKFKKSLKLIKYDKKQYKKFQ